MAMPLALSNGKMFNFEYKNITTGMTLDATSPAATIGELTLPLKSKSSVVHLSGEVCLGFPASATAAKTVSLQIERNGTKCYTVGTTMPRISYKDSVNATVAAFPFEFIDAPKLGGCSNNATYKFILESTISAASGIAITSKGTCTIAAAEIA